MCKELTFTEVGNTNRVHIVTTDGFHSIGELCVYLDENKPSIPVICELDRTQDVFIQNLVMFAYELGRTHANEEE